jgi:hypothetical protein
MKCSHPRAIAYAPAGALTAEAADHLGEHLAAGVQMDEWHSFVVTGECRLEFPECSWCRKPRRWRWFR